MMNPLKTIKSFEKFMVTNAGKSENELADMLCPHIKYGTHFMDIIDLIITYKNFQLK